MKFTSDQQSGLMAFDFNFLALIFISCSNLPAESTLQFELRNKWMQNQNHNMDKKRSVGNRKWFRRNRTTDTHIIDPSFQFFIFLRNSRAGNWFLRVMSMEISVSLFNYSPPPPTTYLTLSTTSFLFCKQSPAILQSFVFIL